MIKNWLQVAGSLALALVVVAGVGAAKVDGAYVISNVRLPQPAAQTIAAGWPNATINAVWSEDRNGLTLYTVELAEGFSLTRVTLDGGGTLEGLHARVQGKAVPDLVYVGLRAAIGNGVIRGITLKEVFADVSSDGTNTFLVTLATPRVEYIASISKERSRGTAVVDGNGNLLRPIQWRDFKDRGNPPPM